MPGYNFGLVPSVLLFATYFPPGTAHRAVLPGSLGRFVAKNIGEINYHILLEKGCNAECIRTWRDSGTNYEPYLHFVHLCINMGMFLSPSLATQLLPGDTGVPNWVPFPGVPPVMTYFSIVSLATVLSLPLFAYIPLRQWRRNIASSNQVFIIRNTCRPLKHF